MLIFTVNKIKKCSFFKYFLLLILLGNGASLLGANYYWVGGSGNWSDVSHWATTSGGGIFHLTPPTIGDDVFFDANSFPSPASKTVTINVNAQCRNMSWVGATHSPILTGGASFTLTIYGNLTFIASMSNTFTGKIIFSALSAGQTITSAGQSFTNVDFTVSTDATNVGYVLQDNFLVNSTLSLLEGVFNTNSQGVTCGRLLTDESNNRKRTLNLSGSSVTITGSGEVFNLGGNNDSLTVVSNPATNVTFTNAGAVAVISGFRAKTIPSLIFTNSNNITLVGEDGAELITYRNITVSQNNATFTVTGNGQKIYNNLNFANNVTAVFNGGATASLFNGTVVFGTGATATFNNTNTFNQAVTLGNNTVAANFTGVTIFNNTLTIGTNSVVNFTGASGKTFTNTINVGASSTITFSNTGINNFANVSIDAGVNWRFSTTAPSLVSGIFAMNASCANPIIVSSNIAGVQANVNLATAQTWNFTSVRDINKTGVGSLTVTNGANLGNNLNISFPTASRNLYWVGGSGNWNSTTNWSLSSGGAGGECPPTSIDNVFFDANSFTAAGQTVTINVEAFCRNMDWTGVTNNPKMGGTNRLNIAGSLVLSPAMTQTGTAGDFSGSVFFTATNTGNTITMAGKTFNTVRFAGIGGEWQLNDAMNVLNNVEAFAGTWNMNNQNVVCGRINANNPADVLRNINFTGSDVTLTLGGTALDLRGTNIGVNEGTATLNLSNNGNIVIEVGTATKTIPNLLFSNTDPTVRTVTVNSSTAPETITFKTITVKKQNIVFNGTSPKVFSGNLTFENNVNATFNGSALTSENKFDGTVSFWLNNNVTFNCGANFNQNVTFGDNAGAGINASVAFNGNVDFSTASAGTLLFIGRNGVFTFAGTNIFRDVEVDENTIVTFSDNNSTFDNLTLNEYDIIRFAANQTTTINNLLNAAVDCQSWISLSSNINGVQANLNFTQNQLWQYVIVKDINATGTGVVTADFSSDIGNNLNIIFSNLNMPKNFYWIGGSGNWTDGAKWSFTDGGPASGCIPTPNDNVFFTDNSFPAGGTCTVNRYVVFCRNMTWQNNTKAGAIAGNTNTIIQIYGSLEFNGAQTTNNFAGRLEFLGSSVSTTKTITTKGTRFWGNLLFNNNDTWVLQDDVNIDNGANGKLTLQYGTLNANNRNINIEGDWLINTPAPSSSIPQATFVAGTGTVTFDGKGNNQVIRVPELAAASCTECSCSTSPFHHLVIDKSTTTLGKLLTLNSGISISGNFTILNGDVVDNGFQIRGNATGTFTMANNTALRLGSASVATVFPSCFTNINISSGTTPGLVADEFNTVNPPASNPAIVEYLAIQHQIVKGTTYGTLVLSGATTGTTFYRRLMDGPITVNGSLIIRRRIRLQDMGFQITGNSFAGNRLQVETSTITLGTGNNVTNGISLPGVASVNLTYEYVTALPTGIPLPPPVATNSATKFPTFTPIGNFDSGMGKMDVKTSTISYTSAAPNQEIQTGFTYNVIGIYAPQATANVRKTLVGSAGYTLDMEGNLIIENRNTVLDSGFQIVGRTKSTMTVNGGNTILVLGSGNKATKFPLNFIAPTMPAGSIVNYNADAPQEISTVPFYSNLTLTAPGITSGVPIPKTMNPPNVVRVNGTITINAYNHLLDNGSQIKRESVPTCMAIRYVTMASNSMFTLGNSAIATMFPQGQVPNFAVNSTVIYNSNQDQIVDDFSSTPPCVGIGDKRYRNLVIASEVPNSPSLKTLKGAIAVRGDLLIKSDNTLDDMGFQITGNNTSPFTLTMENRARLILGSTTSATLFPTAYPKARINLHESSTVIYHSDQNQSVSSVPNYGNLIMRKYTVSTPLVNKTVVPTPAAHPATATLTVNGNLTIDEFNNLLDNGYQIVGTNTKTLTLANNATLTLGTNGFAASRFTVFPNQFQTIDLSPSANPSSTVIFNSDKAGNNIAGQNIGGNPFSYGNVVLNSGGTAVTKNLLSNINIRKNLTINANNTLDATTSNFNINIGGHWQNLGGVFNARNGKVTLDGTNNQNILTNNSHFFSMEITNSQGATMQDNLTVGGIVTFTNGHFRRSASEIMTFKSGATVAGPGTFPGAPGPSNNSFVDAPVRKIGNQAFMFPVGKIISPTEKWFAPIGISAPANASTEFTATYIPANPHPTYNRFLKVPSLHHISQAEYWLLDRAVTTDNVSVTLSWDTPRSGGVDALGDLRVAHWRASTPIWEDGGNGGTVGDETRGTIISASVINNFTPFTLGSITNFNPLPIELVSFEAKPNYLTKTVELLWKTAAEINNDFFVLEKSKNGKDFRPFATVYSKANGGNSQAVLSYQYTDSEPMSGISYYRLKQVDKDASFTFSKIVSVKFENLNEEDRFIIFPTPTEGKSFYMQFLDSEIKNGEIAVYDILGKIVHQQQILNQSTDLISIDFKEKIPTGTYIVKVWANNKVYIKSLVVW